MSATTRLSDYAKSHFSAEELQEKRDYFIAQLKSEELTARQRAFIVERLDACNYLLEEKVNKLTTEKIAPDTKNSICITCNKSAEIVMHGHCGACYYGWNKEITNEHTN